MFLREWPFFDKKWALEQRVLYRIDVFLTKYGHESNNFLREKLKKKGHPIDFLAYNIIV